MNFNKVILLGRVASDVEKRSTTSGQSVCTFRLATNRIWRDKAGERKEDSQFHNIVLWGKQAENASQFMSKGSLVLIEGRLQNRSWEDKTGNKRYTTEIIGENFQLGPKGGERPQSQTQDKEISHDEDIPVIEDGDEIDIKDIPF
ncbi:MAG TPA: single-stranded DNA-binding protein [Candidatus Pacearchaeota archaeon]|nr:single-stranded DNA-binding protein [Candidatus Parcubacteria bacterium]HOC53561.1 single-stranded DNA-binding protein [Candidatus Pacearchaeota archaeon]HQM24478.1 single-stranded DNA-binding protein [Candidatus Pacearchaeota archaeon]